MEDYDEFVRGMNEYDAYASLRRIGDPETILRIAQDVIRELNLTEHATELDRNYQPIF